MLFVCYVTIDPENRRIVEPKGAKLIGAWISPTQQRDLADDAAAIMKLYEPWTDLNVHQIAPVMDFVDLKKFVDANA